MIIIGSGMSGLLAAQYFRSHESVSVLEKQPALPNNHKALLRFRTDAVSTLTGIDFKKVKVSKGVIVDNAIRKETNLAINNQYSQKVLGCIRNRSIGSLDDCIRYIAPEDFIDRLSRGVKVEYNSNALQLITSHKAAVDYGAELSEYEPIISTMPVMALAKMLDYDLGIKLESKPIWTKKVKFNGLDIDVYQTIYNPQSGDFYRASITGDTLIIEYSEDPNDLLTDFDYYERVMHMFGINIYNTSVQIVNGHQKHGKLIECPINAVKKFISYASSKYGIYSLGRWGTHRQILMDDVVDDIKVIHSLIKNDNYKGVI
jgi:hypothetical protein